MKIRFGGAEDDGFGASTSFGGTTSINGRAEALRFGAIESGLASFSPAAPAGRFAAPAKTDAGRGPQNTGPISGATALPTDTLLANQWHLGNPTPGLLDLNVRSVWNPAQGAAYTGAGIRVLVIDDGFDYTHADLAPNYDTGLDYDWDALNNGSNGDHDYDPFGQNSDSHGTAVAGIIGADDNGTGVVGVAFDSSLVGYRLHAYISDGWLQDIRDGIFHAAMSAAADVTNISQGISNDNTSEFGAGYNAVRFDEIEASITTAVDDGRFGLGMTIVKAAGNARADDYDVNADDWTNDTRQVVVAAIDQDGFVSDYSSFGAALLVSAFGTPGQVLTTDRVGAPGYVADDFTNFSGTSAAAPMVAGVVALMYDANAGLGWRDVQSILANSASHVGSDFTAPTGPEFFSWQWNGATTWNGGGLHFSNDYGYGLVNAHAAVRLAETWFFAAEGAQTSANEFTNTVDMLNVATVIPDANLTGLTFTGAAAFDDIVERVTVSLTFSTTFVGDLEVYLISPDGTVSQLIADNGSGGDFDGTWTFESQAFRGELAAGTWSVRIVDDAGGDTLTVSDVVVTTFGAATTNDRYIFTDEFVDYGGLAGHTTAIADTNGGVDVVNASAVTSASIIRLDGTSGLIAGVNVTFTAIEYAVGGDAGDTISGNDSDNSLWGMRGNDTISGGSGTDQLFGGDGDDILSQGFGGPNELLDGGTGIDTADWSYNTFDNWVIDLNAGTAMIGSEVFANLVSIENVIGGAQADEITGNDDANILRGGGGNDIIRARGSNDELYGESGNDTLYGDAGTDFVSGGDHNDTIIISGGHGLDNADGGAGVDLLDYSTAFGGAITFNLATGVFNFAGNLRTATGFEYYNDSDSNGTITGTAGANIINGNGGSDIIEGGAGADTLNGGDGIDTASYALAAARVVARLNGAAGSAGDANGDMLTNFENLTGSAFNDSLIGANLANNVLDGGNGDDFLYGLSGDDTLIGGAGNDTADGGDGHDSINTGAGNDTVLGGSGNDTIDTLAGNDTIDGGDGDDIVQASVGDDIVNGGAGNDTLTAGSGADTVHGGTGDDIIFGITGADVLNGNDGNDVIEGGTDADTMDGGAGIDTVRYAASAAAVTIRLTPGGAISGGDAAGDILSNFENAIGSNHNDFLIGANGIANRLEGGLGNDYLDGLSGDDMLLGGDGADQALGKEGNDTIEGGAGIDNLDGGIGDDLISGGADGDTINGGDGNDTLQGGAGGDTINGGTGVDTVIYNSSSAAVTVRLGGGVISGGEAAGDVITNVENATGSEFNDTLIGSNAISNLLQGGNGADFLGGLSGSDTLIGGGGNDRIDGGLDSDSLTGGAGADTFIFNTTLGASNIDTITDFVAVDDIIHIDDAVFLGGGLAAGALLGTQFTVGASATTAAHRIIYNSATGALSYDADGNGAGAAVQFATLGTGLGLTAADFLII